MLQRLYNLNSPLYYSKTTQGETCLPWNRQNLDPSLKYLEKNYCRNPGGEEDAPFCVTGKQKYNIIIRKSGLNP